SRHRGGGAAAGAVRGPRRGRRALRAPAGGGRALGPPQAPGPRRSHRGSPGRRPQQARPGRGHRPHPPEQARPLPRGRRNHPAGGHLRRRDDHLRRPPLPRGPAGGRHRPPPAPPAHPGGGRLTARPRHLALVGPTASGKSALALEVARRLPDVELVSVDSMQVYRGMDVGTAKPTAAERAEIPHHLLDLADPTENFSVARFQAEAEAAIAAIERRGHRALLVGGTGLYLQAVVDGLRLPGRWPDVRAELEKEVEREPAAVGAMHRRLADADPTAAARIEPGNARRIVRALEVTLGSGQPFSSFGPGLDAYPATDRFR